ncbi:unnamed protein product, partial [Prorocentrum cordatum]
TRCRAARGIANLPQEVAHAGAGRGPVATLPAAPHATQRPFWGRAHGAPRHREGRGAARSLETLARSARLRGGGRRRRRRRRKESR